MPNPKKYSEIKSTWWYRLANVLFWIVVVFTFFIPFMRVNHCGTFCSGKFNSFGDNILDGVTGALINGIILYAIWRIILYIAYGSIDKKTITKPHSISRIEPSNSEKKDYMLKSILIAVGVIVAFMVGSVILVILVASNQ